MKALVIAPQPFLSPRGTPFSVYYRTLMMSELGIKVDLLTYGQGWDVDIPGVRLIRVPNLPWSGPIKTGPSVVKLLLDVLITLWTVGLLIRRRYDFVHAHEEGVFHCALLKPIFRFKLVYDMHSSLPQQLRNFGFTESRLLISIFTKLEELALKRADAVITICPSLAEYAVPRLRGDAKHVLIENSIFEPVRLAPRENGAAHAEDGLVALPRDRLIVNYAGTFEAYQGLETLLEAFSKAKRAVPQALLLMVGGTEHQIRTLQELTGRLGISDDVVFTGQVGPETCQRYVDMAHVLTSPRSHGTNTPLKVYQQLASGKPLVATRIYAHTQVLSDKVAILVEPEPADMARGIVQALSDSALARKKADAAKALYAAKYSRQAYERKVRAVLTAL